jgi:hypothetical protein
VGDCTSGFQDFVASATKMLGSVPAVDEDEGSFRRHMTQQAKTVAAVTSDFAALLCSADKLQEAGGSAGPHVPEELRRQAEELSSLSFYHVSFFAALTQFRRPAGETSDKMEQILQTIEAIPPREHWRGAALLQEMRERTAAAKAAAAARGLKERKQPQPQSKQQRGRGRGRGAAPASAMQRPQQDLLLRQHGRRREGRANVPGPVTGRVPSRAVRAPAGAEAEAQSPWTRGR